MRKHVFVYGAGRGGRRNKLPIWFESPQTPRNSPLQLDDVAASLQPSLDPPELMRRLAEELTVVARAASPHRADWNGVTKQQ